MAGSKAFNQLEDLLALKGIRLGPGDRVKVHTLSCLDIATHKLVRAVVKLLKAGVSFELCSPKVLIEPERGIAHTILAELDIHYRHIHGIKTHPPDMARSGRKPFLDPSKLEEIRAALGEPGATQAQVAQSFGVARSTLFNYLERHDRERPGRRSRKAEDRRLEATDTEIDIPAIKADPPSEGV